MTSVAVEDDVAAGERLEAGQRPQRGGLAGAVGAEHAEHRTVRNGQLDVHSELSTADDQVRVEAHEPRPAFSTRSRRETRMTTETTSNTSESAIAASGSVSSAM